MCQARAVVCLPIGRRAGAGSRCVHGNVIVLCAGGWREGDVPTVSFSLPGGKFYKEALRLSCCLVIPFLGKAG